MSRASSLGRLASIAQAVLALVICPLICFACALLTPELYLALVGAGHQSIYFIMAFHSHAMQQCMLTP